MNFLKYFVILIMFFLFGCVETKQINGINFDKINNFNIEIGKTSKSILRNKYGPPTFESPFKKDMIYYISQNTLYKNLSAPQVEKMVLYEIFIDENGLVKNYNKYNEKEIINIEVAQDEKNLNDNTLRKLFKQMIKNLQRRDIEN